MNFFAISAIVNVITAVVLGLLVLFRDRRATTNITFFLFTVAIGIWSIAYFFWQISTSADEAQFWIHIFMSGAIFIPFFYLHFIVAFIRKDHGLSIAVVTGYVAAIAFSIINWTPLFIGEITNKLNFEFWPTAGPLYLPFLAVWAFYAFFAAAIIAKHMRLSHGQRRAQLQYMLVGTLIGYIGGLTNYFLWFDIPIMPYGNISASIYIALVAYAVLKYRLFDVKVIATEFLVFVLWLFIFIRMILAATVQEQLTNGTLLLVTVVVGALLIRSVDQEVETREHIENLAENLRHANDRLRELDRQKSEFLSIAAHQLRTPLTAVKGYSSMLLEDSYGVLPQEVKKIIETIFASTSRMADTVADFLNVSRIEQGRMEYRMQHADIGVLVKSVVTEMQITAREKGLTLECTDDGTGPYNARLDVSKIEEVISNLIDNAIKYTEKGKVSVHIKRNTSSHTVRITISDTGAGIPKDALPTLFDKFVRARNAKEINVTGTGLGLYVAREMVDAHGGRIWAESRGERRGSTFSVDLPLVN